MSGTMKYGLLTVDMERSHRIKTGEQLHVWYRGFDVTQRCYMVDDIVGYAYVFCKDPLNHDPLISDGKTHRNGDFLCRHRLDGGIVIKPGDKL